MIIKDNKGSKKLTRIDRVTENTKVHKNSSAQLEIATTKPCQPGLYFTGLIRIHQDLLEHTRIHQDITKVSPGHSRTQQGFVGITKIRFDIIRNVIDIDINFIATIFIATL